MTRLIPPTPSKTPKNKENLDKRALSIQNNTSQALSTHEKLKCNSVHSYFDALFFHPINI